MPIRPENRARYPDDWPEISARVREEAGQKCEWCDVPNGVLIRRATADDGRHVWRLLSDSAYEDGRYEDGSVAPDTGEDTCDWSDPVKVVLTVAHMDHRPENCARENLKALCQRCHNRYDAPMRRAGIAERAKAACAARDLFEDT